MSMDHKAYELSFAQFERELAPVLVRALQTGDMVELQAFVHRNLSELKDPDEGGPVGPDWRELVTPPVANRPDLELQLWGDLALTKYYDPAQDRGLSTDWEDAERALDQAGTQGARILLGRPLQVDGQVFDPGRQGAYFQSPADVRAALGMLEGSRLAADDHTQLGAWGDLLRSAVSHGTGLYVTF